MLRINPMIFSLFPLSVPLLRQIPMIDVIKLINIKGIATKAHKKTNPPPSPSFIVLVFIIKAIVITQAIDAEMIEITPRPLEAIVLGEWLSVGTCGGTSFERIPKP
jgi:hypothetical protein